MKKITDCLENSFEYASQEIMENGLKDNTFYSYISSTFCNGIVNWIENRRAYMLGRYRVGDENNHFDMLGESLIDTDNPRENEFYKEWFEIYDRIQALKQPHTDLTIWRDDIIVTGETEKSYWMIWFDCDVSDSCVCKISKDNYSSLDEFNDAVQDYIHNSQETFFLEINKPVGWAKF